MTNWKTLTEEQKQERIMLTKRGQAKAKAKGIHIGRPTKITEQQKKEICNAYKKGKITCTEIVTIFNISVTGLYRIIPKKFRRSKKQKRLKPRR